MSGSFHLNKAVAITAIACALLFVSACSNQKSSLASLSDASGEDSNNSVEPPSSPPDAADSTDRTNLANPTTDPATDSATDSGITQKYVATPLSWESKSYPARAQWSAYLQRIILTKWTTLLAGADDIEEFCPRYYRLDNPHRANAWAAIFSGVAKYESAYNPKTRFHERTMGTDPITGQPVYSEGLLQLSYQDIRPYPFCDFEWSVDKKLASSDARKTIFDPKKNLDCGVGIMSRQVARSGRVTVSSRVYWSTLKLNGRYSKIAEIKTILKKQPYCF